MNLVIHSYKSFVKTWYEFWYQRDIEQEDIYEEHEYPEMITNTDEYDRDEYL